MEPSSAPGLISQRLQEEMRVCVWAAQACVDVCDKNEFWESVSVNMRPFSFSYSIQMMHSAHYVLYLSSSKWTLSLVSSIIFCSFPPLCLLISWWKMTCNVSKQFLCNHDNISSVSAMKTSQKWMQQNDVAVDMNEIITAASAQAILINLTRGALSASTSLKRVS